MKANSVTFLFLVFILGFFSACSPKEQFGGHGAIWAEKRPEQKSIHGIMLQDDYAWLKNKKDSTVISYLESENNFANTTMKDTEALQEQLFTEMKGRIKEEDQSAPVKLGGYFYYNRTEANKQYKLICRIKDAPDAQEEIILDQNELAKGKKFMSVGNYSVSPDQQLMAYTLDSTGAEIYDLYFKNLGTGKMLEEVIPNVSYSIVWANDNQTLFYNINDETTRPYKVFKHKLGVPYVEDMQVFHEEDDRYFVSISKSKNEKYLIIDNHSKITSESYLLSANDPNGEFKIFAPRKEGVEYNVTPHEGLFYILTNENAVNYKLMSCPENSLDKSNWIEVIAHNEKVKLEFIEEMAGFLAIAERTEGLRKVRIMDLKNKTEHYIDFPDPIYNVGFSGNVDFNSPNIRLSYSSLVWPNVVYDYNLSTKQRTDVKLDEVSDYDAHQYVSERIFATSEDGTQIPISLVYKKGVEKNGNNPLLLYGYGSYGSITSTAFSAPRISLLNRGFIFAVAHIRGSGDMGEQWYQDGKYLKKKNTFTDFISCGEYLISQNYTNPDKMAAIGGSAGGLLMGAVANMKPEIFQSIIAKVPFVDVINTMLDPNLPLTVTEYEEWGDPNEKEYFDYMLSYSPYENVSEQDYPNMLVTVGLNDPRVGYWEGAKWVAKLRATKTDNNTLLLKTNMGAGHMGSSGRYDYLKETAFEYAFLLKTLSIN